ncbi:hypothetical protein FB451DRAFT_1190283 [Mycena latifolia]|nr:hypothetical protein FB451DRAFT_1190283 [Mycena latifolia]
MPETEGNLSAHTPHRPRGSPAPPGPPRRRCEAQTTPPSSRKRRRSCSPPGPPPLRRFQDRQSTAGVLRRSSSPTGCPPRRKRQAGDSLHPRPTQGAGGRAPAGAATSTSRTGETVSVSKALVMAWLQDNTPPVRALVSPDAGGYVCLTDHKVQLGELALEQQRALEKYGIGQDGRGGWAGLLWDTPVYVQAGKPVLLRYHGVSVLDKWDDYAQRISNFCRGIQSVSAGRIGIVRTNDTPAGDLHSVRASSMYGWARRTLGEMMKQ